LIITDQGQMYSTYIKKFTDELYHMGIPIKCNAIGKSFLHCKFIIADDLLIHGSMNMGK